MVKLKVRRLRNAGHTTHTGENLFSSRITFPYIAFLPNTILVEYIR